ncbi:MAG TPA: hypothetical protein EYF95_03635 [Flavobacteriales bacterium]|jgi:hypothetical protein|nr:hypothetical protein [Flavobacteriales bacterium]
MTIKREGCHTEINTYEPDGGYISGVEDPVDLLPVIKNLISAGEGKLITTETEMHALSIENAVARAEILDSQLTQEVMDIPGSASYKNRAFLNNLMASTSDADFFDLKNYLEIGCHLGSTFISACFANKDLIKEAYVIDKFLHGENSEEEFQENCVRFLGEAPTNLFCEDCFTIDIQKIKEKVDVYFFDGPHGILDHEKALTYYEPVFNDNLIVVIDDWGDHRVKLGTLRGLAKINYRVVWFHEMPAHRHISDWGMTIIPRYKFQSETNPMLSGFGDPCRWWNGTIAMVLSRK